MPIYEFVCADCGHEFESLQRLNEAPPDSCPKCGGGEVSKKISAAGFRLKGGGWYETDFKNKKKAASGGSEGNSESGSASSTDSSPPSTKSSESASGSGE